MATAPACAVRVLAGQPVRQVRADPACVDGGTDATEDGDTERAAEFAARLHQCGRRACPFGGNRPDDEVRHQGQDHDQPESKQAGADDRDSERRGGTQSRQHEEPGGGDQEPARLVRRQR